MKNVILFILVIVLFVACKKEVTELPPATQSGANTFGAKVNGQLWGPLPFGSIPASNLLEARFISNDSELFIQARNFASSPNETEMHLFIVNAKTVGTYQLNTTTTPSTITANYGYFVKRNISPQNEWMTSATYTGTVTITAINKEQHFVSGTFQFSALNLYNAPEPMTVTEGRFDVKTN